MESFIIEIIRILPSLIVIALVVFVFIKYSNQINKLINKLSDSNLSRVDLFSAKLDFVVSFEDKNTEHGEIKHKSISLPYNSYSLLKRIDFVLSQQIKVNVLWIEDNGIKIINQKKRLTELGMNIKHVDSSEAALKILIKEKDTFQLIISDTMRNEDENEGYNFIKQLVEVHHISIPTIFYTGAYDYSKGLPPYTFGIACMPYDLLWLCLDIMERNIVESPEQN